MYKEYGFNLFLETSAKTGFNAQKLFIEAGKILYEEHLRYKKEPKISGQHLKKKMANTEKKKKKCCQINYEFIIIKIY